MDYDYKPLNLYTDEELYNFLENNNIMELNALAAICSEVLRRMLKEKINKNEK